MLVAACAQAEDDPNNAPRLGNWNTSMQLVAVTVNGVREERYLPERIVEQFGGRYQGEELGCTEPQAMSVDDLNAQLPDAFARMCTLRPVSSIDKATRFEAVCDAEQFPEGLSAMAVDGVADVGVDRVTLDIEGNFTVQTEGGSSDRVGVEVRRSFWRVGDCPA